MIKKTFKTGVGVILALALWINTKFYVDSALKDENIVLLNKYNALLSKDVPINFIDISNDGYKSFARLSDNGKKAFVRKYVTNIESKIESISNSEE